MERHHTHGPGRSWLQGVGSPAASLSAHPLLALQRKAGNRAVSAMVQRELAAYTSEHVEILDTGSDSPAVESETTSADAPRLTAALQPLVDQNKITTTTHGDQRWWHNATATDPELRAALASLPKVDQMIEALKSGGDVFVYAKDDVIKMSTLFGTSDLMHTSDGVSRETTRPATSEERDQAAIIFGSSLNLDGITLSEDAVMSVGGYARTLPHTVYLPVGEMSKPNHIALMMHEFTHLWQYQHGVSVVTTAYNAVKGNYDFGGDSGLRAASAAGKKFVDFNTEQQGDICQAYWALKTSNGDTTAYDPFIAQVQAGG